MFEYMNSLGRDRVPFLFIISYDKSQIFIQKLHELDSDIYYKLNQKRNYKKEPIDKTFFLKKSPISFDRYKEAIYKVKEHIKAGDTYLLNLTFQTPIDTDLSMLEIFKYSQANYKLYFKDTFVCFSPERFIKIESNTISTYPMKGTIDANIDNAKEKILQDTKEMAEHTMIVDLMRNDLGIVANSVRVEKFRYIDKIKAGEKELYQVSSHIEAKVDKLWHQHIGDILDSITPAGSITGTPKRKTIEIIESIEDYDRDFYTGIFGIYDGNSLDSSVMIRFIDKQQNSLYYKSGGGITLDSSTQSEYQELIDKIYLPI